MEFKSSLKKKIVTAAVAIGLTLSFPALIYTSFKFSDLQPHFEMARKVLQDTDITPKVDSLLCKNINDIDLRLECLVKRYDASKYEETEAEKVLKEKYGAVIKGLRPNKEEIDSFARVLHIVQPKYPIDFYIIPKWAMMKNKEDIYFGLHYNPKKVFILKDDGTLVNYNMEATIRHELAHSYHYSFKNSVAGKKFEAKWRKLNKSSYKEELHGITFKLFSGEEITSANEGFITSHGANNIDEDIAEYVKEIHKLNYNIFPPGFAYFEENQNEVIERLKRESQIFTIDVDKTKYLATYEGKFKLLKEDRFISDKEYEETIKWFEFAQNINSLSKQELSKLEQENYEKGLKLIQQGLATEQTKERIEEYKDLF